MRTIHVNQKHKIQKFFLFGFLISSLLAVFLNCSAGGGGGAAAVTPAPSPGAGSTSATQISVGNVHTCALLADSTVKCWGDNSSGQLGNGTTTTSTAPVSVSGISTATAIATSAWMHSCALLSNSTVKCWGMNSSGQLGDSTTTQSLNPVAVTGISAATAIAIGNRHSCALLSNSTVKCWGRNIEGQLGDGTNTNRSSPVAVSGISTAIAISTGGSNSCALLSNNTVKCWGSNSSGQLGDGTTTYSSVPVTVSGISTATALTAGSYHNCVLLTGNTMKCWGANDVGQLGDATMTTPRLTAVTVSGISTATAIGASGESAHTCAVLSGGTVKCWGANSNGQIGNGSTTGPQSCSGFVCSTSAVSVLTISTATAVALGNAHTCALLSDGSVKCWGLNGQGQLGDGTTSDNVTPTAVVGL